MKVRSTKSARDVISDLDLAYERGYLERPVRFGNIHTYLGKPELTPVLRSLVQESSKPLAAVETTFAYDSTGFSTCQYTRWEDIKYRGATEHDWVKAHFGIGVKTHIITDMIIEGRDASDLSQLPELLRITSENFTILEVLADKVYNTVKNQEKSLILARPPTSRLSQLTQAVIRDRGGIPIISTGIGARNSENIIT